MYTVTFYSFKGGVGRSMALVNVAAQLAEDGKRVLMVDFDLEAPGLMSYGWNCTKQDTMGLVEYVTNYRKTFEAPAVQDYLCKSKTFEGGGEIWIMPAGRHDADYSGRLNDIDWHQLYKQEDGYLLFEDLKSQWRNSIAPDYVLIDSRTGHSDVEGICTRQLPDAVALLFFPNEQNLQGLARVTKSIAAQNDRRKNTRDAIKLHFVASNVPDLDDEEEIVGRRLEQFKNELGYNSLAATIHHYSSLSLLDQDVFSLSRPKSKLTREYKKLFESIVRENLRERSAALLFLKKTQKELREGAPAELLTISIARVERILIDFPLDSEIAYQGALVFESIGRVADALALLSGNERTNDAVALAVRARLHHRLDKKQEAINDLSEMLKVGGAELSTFIEAMSYIGQLAPRLYEEIPTSVAFASLDRRDKVFAALGFDEGIDQLKIQVRLLTELLREDSPENGLIKHSLALASIGTGDFQKAVSLLSELFNADADISEHFNMGMALWALQGEPTRSWFEKVAEFDKSNFRRDESPNYMQCLAITHGVLGDFDTAARFVFEARRMMNVRPRRQFSAWTYSNVSAEKLISHLQALEMAIEERVRPVPDFIANSAGGADIRIH